MGYLWYTGEEFLCGARESGLELVEWGTAREIESQSAISKGSSRQLGGILYVLKKPAGP